jgi:hypothetical protein
LDKLFPSIERRGTVESSKLGYWLQVGANIGLLAGLMLVGFQIQQNSQILRTQVITEESRRAVDQEWLVVGENGARVWAKSISDPANLTLEEQRIMEAFLWTAVENWLNTYRLSEEGLVDFDWRTRLGESAFFFGNPYGRGWWNVRRNQLLVPAELMEAVDKILEAVSPNYTTEYQAAVLAEVERLIPQQATQ